MRATHSVSLRDGVRGARIIRAVATTVAGGFALLGCATSGTRDPAGRDGWLRAAGFHERASWESSILHLDRRQIPARARLAVLVGRAPDVSLGEPHGEEWGVRRRRSDGVQCDVAVFLNGARIRRHTAGGDWTLPFLIQASDLDGIEVHVGPGGPLMEEQDCGALLLWSRAAAAGEPAQFHGSIEGSVWGEGAESVTHVALEGSSRLAELDEKGNFRFDAVLPGLHRVLAQGPQGIVAADTVRVFAFATSSIGVLIQ